MNNRKKKIKPKIVLGWARYAHMDAQHNRTEPVVSALFYLAHSSPLTAYNIQLSTKINEWRTFSTFHELLFLSENMLLLLPLMLLLLAGSWHILTSKKHTHLYFLLITLYDTTWKQPFHINKICIVWSTYKLHAPNFINTKFR